MAPGQLGIPRGFPHERKQRSFAPVPEGLYVRNSGTNRVRLEQRVVGGANDRHLWIRVAQEIIHLVGRVRRIDGHEHRTHAQACDVEQHRLQRFVHLNRDSVAGHDAPPHQGCGKSAGLLAQGCVVQLPALGGLEEGPVGLIAGGAFNPVGGIRSGEMSVFARHESGQSSMMRLCTRVSRMVNATKKLIPANAEA